MEQTYRHWSAAKTAPTAPQPIADLDGVRELVEAGALFAISTSGGKDSLATMLAVLEVVPADQCVLVHANLGESEHSGLLELIEAQNVAQLPLVIAEAYHADGEPKSFFSMIRRRKVTLAESGRETVSPMPINRAKCRATSELKTGPIWRELKAYAKAHGFDTIVNCTGVRAAESKSRAADIEKHGALYLDDKRTNSLWDMYHWRPVAHWSVQQVFAAIDQAGLPMHPAYLEGNARLSCAFCVFGSKGDLANATRRYPELARTYLAFEAEIGHPMHVSGKPLAELLPVQILETKTENVA